MTMSRIGLATVALVVLQPLLIGAQLPKSDYTAYGSGTASCGKWTESATAVARTGNLTLVHAAREQWVLGFVSGAGWSLGSDLRKTDAVALGKWIDNYCQQNPLEGIAQAAAQLVVELKSR